LTQDESCTLSASKITAGIFCNESKIILVYSAPSSLSVAGGQDLPYHQPEVAEGEVGFQKESKKSVKMGLL